MYGRMTQAKVRHFPVVERGQVIGPVSIGDLVHAQLAGQHVLIEQLGKLYFRQYGLIEVLPAYWNRPAPRLSSRQQRAPRRA
jgi:predicted transcriptional regulator